MLFPAFWISAVAYHGNILHKSTSTQNLMTNVYRIEILEDYLKTLITLMRCIKEAVIVSSDGFVVASYPPAESEEIVGKHQQTHTPQVAAMAAALIALSDQTLLRLDQGEMQRLMIEGDEGSIIVYPINSNAALAVLVDSSSKMGLTLYEIARVAREFAALLPE